MSELIPIGLVAAQLGISTSTLRKWEQRYGYPKPVRSKGGQRFYSAEHLVQLKQAMRLIDKGYPTSVVLGLQGSLLDQSNTPTTASTDPQCDSETTQISELFELLTSTQLERAQSKLLQLFETLELTEVIDHILAPLLRQVGDAWFDQRISVYQEHAISMMIRSMLYRIIHLKGQGNGPVVLLVTPSGERHDTSLLLVETALSSSACQCINLGASLTVEEIQQAAEFYSASIVGVSVGSILPSRTAQNFVNSLRALLPDSTRMWVGGAGVRGLNRLSAGCEVLNSTREAAQLLAREKHDHSFKPKNH